WAAGCRQRSRCRSRCRGCARSRELHGSWRLRSRGGRSRGGGRRGTLPWFSILGVDRLFGRAVVHPGVRKGGVGGSRNRDVPHHISKVLPLLVPLGLVRRVVL